MSVTYCAIYFPKRNERATDSKYDFKSIVNARKYAIRTLVKNNMKGMVMIRQENDDYGFLSSSPWEEITIAPMHGIRTGYGFGGKDAFVKKSMIGIVAKGLDHDHFYKEYRMLTPNGTIKS